ncbi:hypothetical protein [Aristaeella lactis]|uniref:Uncharacterized protein n=1 Tax=Aristaeella lactis TaxID=3046383 RepID=A0AC61PNX0_9FIRM|nr:hypothetical protein [Aristaeella lactis]QUA52550.1 hypothetical protein JYE50_12710 [Aristaeella lactis]SMC77100.1 hypothetical protein SAMN06297397_2429 [Aristaeella lactis]
MKISTKDTRIVFLAIWVMLVGFSVANMSNVYYITSNILNNSCISLGYTINPVCRCEMSCFTCVSIIIYWLKKRSAHDNNSLSIHMKFMIYLSGFLCIWMVAQQEVTDDYEIYRVFSTSSLALLFVVSWFGFSMIFVYGNRTKKIVFCAYILVIFGLHVIICDLVTGAYYNDVCNSLSKVIFVLVMSIPAVSMLLCGLCNKITNSEIVMIHRLPYLLIVFGLIISIIWNALIGCSEIGLWSMLGRINWPVLITGVVTIIIFGIAIYLLFAIKCIRKYRFFFMSIILAVFIELFMGYLSLSTDSYYPGIKIFNCTLFPAFYLILTTIVQSTHHMKKWDSVLRLVIYAIMAIIPCLLCKTGNYTKDCISLIVLSSMYKVPLIIELLRYFCRKGYESNGTAQDH